MRLHRFILFPALCVAVSGCALFFPAEKGPQSDAQIVRSAQDMIPFSKNAVGGLPTGYARMVIFRTRKQTQYNMVQHQNRRVLHAYAKGATSGLRQLVSIDPTARPWINWQWKIGAQAVNHAQRATEDSPARIVLGFDGNKDILSFADQILFDMAKLITGHDFPFATLMYKWDSKEPVGSVAQSRRTSRIRTMVVDHGHDGVGHWREFTRNIVEDYKKAYGEMPGNLIAIGVLTDTDIADETVEAWYGDIRFLPHHKNVGTAAK